MTPVVFVGGGGHASVLLDAAQAFGVSPIAGYTATRPGPLSDAGVEYLGGDESVSALRMRGIVHAILGVAGARDNNLRAQLFDRWKAAGFTFVTLIHPTAVVSSRASHGEGLQCLALAVVNAGSVLGLNVIINTAAVVEHDCVIGDHAHIAPGAVLCGGVHVGARSLIGAGSTVVPGAKIGADVLIAAGSVVTRDVPAGQRMAGVPAAPIAAEPRRSP